MDHRYGADRVRGGLRLTYGLGLIGLLTGLIGGLLNGLIGLFELGRITPAEALRWSWRKARGKVFVGLLIGLLIGLGLMGLFGAGLSGLAFGVALGLLIGLIGGVTQDQIITRTIPNEGIRRSLRNALIIWLGGGLAFGLVFIERAFGLFTGLFTGLIGGLFMGLFGGLDLGGRAYLKHYWLRFLLWRNDYAPWNYIKFLDYASERVFLRKAGGGYIFTHRLLMEHFATMQPTNQAQQSFSRSFPAASR